MPILQLERGEGAGQTLGSTRLIGSLARLPTSAEVGGLAFGEQVGIDGAVIVPLSPIVDERGAFLELYRREWSPGGEMVQSNLSRSRAGVLRGLHFHREQADYWVVSGGSALVGLFDLRGKSPTEGVAATVDMTAEEPRGLYIPAGVAHGFYARTDVALHYFVDRYFDNTDEFGVAWNDAEIGIVWPDDAPMLSERDRSNPSLAEVRASDSTP